MEKNGLFNDFSLEELEKISKLIKMVDSREELLSKITLEINRRKKTNESSLNVRFDFDMFKRLQMFDYDELRVLEVNCINNLQELIDCDLNSLVGVTSSIKEKLEWARKFYDMSKRDNNVRKK